MALPIGRAPVFCRSATDLPAFPLGRAASSEKRVDRAVKIKWRATGTEGCFKGQHNACARDQLS